MKAYTQEIINDMLGKYEHGERVGLRHIFYRNIIGYRKGGVMYNMSQREKAEWAKCYVDPVYFIENYCKYMTIDGFHHITLRDYQKDIIDKYVLNRFNIIMNSRQVGLSMIIGMLMLWEAMFKFDKNIVLIANKMCSSVEVLDRIKKTYQNLPYFLQVGVENFSAKSIKFDNGCRLEAMSSSSSRHGFGYALHKIFIQDYAHVNPKYLADIFPTFAHDHQSQVFIQSTPNGFNQFYELYSNAEQGKNSFVPTRIYWWQVPGRDNEWKENKIRNLGSRELFAQEYDLQFLTSKKRY